MSAKAAGIVNTNDAGTDQTTYYLPLNNLAATTAPTVTDDDAAGYIACSLWVDIVTHKVYVLRNNATGAADWLEVTSGGGITFTIGNGLNMSAGSVLSVRVGDYGDIIVSEVTDTGTGSGPGVNMLWTIDALAVTTAKIAANAVTAAKVGSDVVVTAGTNAFAADQSMGSHKLTNVTDPISAQDAATKGYVDAAVAALEVKNDCQAATTSALAASTYNNGAAGVGATITLTAAAVLVLDGYTPALNDRLLIKNQGSPTENGIYTLTTVGVLGVTQAVLTRATDFDQHADGIDGALVYVLNGTTNGNTLWVCTTTGTVVFGTTNINWSQFTGTTYTADGTTLQLVGTTFSVKDAELLAIAGLTSAANKGIYFTGSGTAATFDFTPGGFSLTLSANATMGGTHSGTSSGTNTGDQTLASLLTQANVGGGLALSGASVLSVRDGDYGDVNVSEVTDTGTGSGPGVNMLWTVESAAGAFAWKGVLNPPTIAATQNDYNPTGLSSASVIRVSTDSVGRVITGIAGGTSGRQLILENVGPYLLFLVTQSVGSSAANRIAWTSLMNIASITLPSGGSVTLLYDGTISRWSVVSANYLMDGHIYSSTSAGAYLISDGTRYGSYPFTGDITSTQDGIVTIGNNAITTVKLLDANVTLAKIASAAANSKLLGSGASGVGVAYSELSLGTGLSMTGTTLNGQVGTVTSVATAGLATGGPITTTGTVTVRIATQADEENGTGTGAAVTPGRQQYHASATKAWIKFDGTGTGAGSPTVSAQYNISSLARNATGDWTVTWATGFSSTEYVVGVAAKRDSAGGTPGVCFPFHGASNPTATTLRIAYQSTGGTALTAEQVYAEAWGDFT